MPALRDPGSTAPADIVEFDGDLFTLDPHWARCVMDVAGVAYGGYASGFATELIDLAFTCDQSNLARLRKAFPEACNVVMAWRYLPMGAKATALAAAK